MRFNPITAVAVLIGAAMISITGYEITQQFVPPGNAMVTMSYRELEREIHQNDGYHEDQVKSLRTALDACVAKLPPTPTPKETPRPTITYPIPNCMRYYIDGQVVTAPTNCFSGLTWHN